MSAVESFAVIHNGVASTAAPVVVGVDGATMGKIQVDDAGSGSFQVDVRERVHPSAEWRTLATITAEGVTELRLFGVQDIDIGISDNTGATAISVYLGLNS